MTKTWNKSTAFVLMRYSIPFWIISGKRKLSSKYFLFCCFWLFLFFSGSWKFCFRLLQFWRFCIFLRHRCRETKNTKSPKLEKPKTKFSGARKKTKNSQTENIFPIYLLNFLCWYPIRRYSIPFWNIISGVKIFLCFCKKPVGVLKRAKAGRICKFTIVCDLNFHCVCNNKKWKITLKIFRFYRFLRFRVFRF